MNQKFTIGGKGFELSRDKVEKDMRGVEPKSIFKYGVKIGNKTFPPKQVLNVCLKLGPAEFTTMDAIRVLKKLGFEIEYYE